MERASFGRTTGRKGQKGAPLEVDHVGRKISLEPKLSIKFSTEISEIFGIMKSTPDVSVFHPTSKCITNFDCSTSILKFSLFKIQ